MGAAVADGSEGEQGVYSAQQRRSFGLRASSDGGRSSLGARSSIGGASSSSRCTEDGDSATPLRSSLGDSDKLRRLSLQQMRAPAGGRAAPLGGEERALPASGCPWFAGNRTAAD